MSVRRTRWLPALTALSCCSCAVLLSPPRELDCLLTSSLAMILSAALLLAATSPLGAPKPPGFRPDPAWRPAVPFAPTSLGGVSACAVDSTAGEVYVGQRGKSSPSIVVLDEKTGQYKRGFGEGVFKTVHGMHMQDGGKYLWVTDAKGSVVHKFLAATGQLLATIGEHGTGLAPTLQFGSVADIAFDAHGAVYISDGDGGCNARVIKLDKSLKLLWAVGNNGTVTNPNPFKSPHSLAYSAALNILFVADRNNNQLRAFDPKTGEETATPWRSAFHSPGCDAPAVWSVRASGRSVYVSAHRSLAVYAVPVWLAFHCAH
jgi:DNA-binding beta-propeller fold protein YncE